MEFKKGDKVRLIKHNCSGINVGDICIIEEYRDGHLYAMTKKSKENGSGCICWNNFELISSNYKPKTPSHIVVWKEDTDPCKFFNSLEEANEFVKELSEKSSVKKDSIILVEIKTARKVTIQKSLRKSEYKI